MTTIDTGAEAVKTLFVALLDEAHEDCVFVDSAVGVNDTQVQLDRIAAARDLVPALLKERDEARAKVKALAEALEWYVSQDDTNTGDEPMPDRGNRTWNEINAYWIEGKRKAETVLAKIKEAEHE